MSILFKRLARLALSIPLSMLALSSVHGKDEDLFGHLRERAEAWRATASLQQLDVVSTAERRLTECPSHKPEGSTAAVEIDGRVFRYMNIDAADDKYCFYLIDPLNRGLTLDEARIFSAALILRPSTPYQRQPKTAEAQTQESAAFIELRAAATSGKYEWLQEGATTSLEQPSFVDCSTESSQVLEQLSGGQTTAFLYNGIYVWKEIPSDGGLCVYMAEPLARGLTAEEASDFSLATHLKLGVSKQYLEKQSPSIEKDDQQQNESDGNSVSDQNPESVTTGLPTRLTNTAYPYNTIALLIDDTSNSNPGTAVQVSANVYMTAAHVVVDAGLHQRSGLKIKPAYKLPSTPSGYYFEAVWDPAYTGVDSDPHNVAHDIAFIRVNTPRVLSAYARPWKVFESRDIGFPNVVAVCGGLGSQSDPFYFSENGLGNSWYYDYDCFGYGTIKQVVGYPSYVGSYNNSQHYPYIATPVTFQGNLFQSLYRELYHPCVGCLPAISMVNSLVKGGNSGGPVFGLQPTSATIGWRLLGIVGREVINTPPFDGTAGGNFEYNNTWIQSQVGWVPTTAITITSPTEGGTYARQSVPNLVASAGTQTSQLQWKSDADGVLGTGGNVVVAGRLSPGARTITATIGSGTSGTNEKATIDTVYKTVHIVVTGSDSPMFTINPAQVQIPATATTGPFTFTWNAPSYSSLDLQGQINGGTWGAPVWIPNSGINGDSIPLGDVWTYRFLPHGATSPVLGTITVAGIAAPPPYFYITPAQVVIQPNQTSGPYAFGWNAPGYQSLDLWGKVNDEPWHIGPEIPAAGNNGNNLAASVTHQYRFYPHGDSTHILGALTVTGVPAVSPTCSINPSVVIVPANATSGNFTFMWSAPGYASLDLWGKINNDPWHFGLGVAAIGNSGDTIPVGTTYQYRFYPPGDSTHILCSLSVTARH